MLLLHLFKLPHNDTERNQVPTLPEMGIYRDNLSAIVIGDNFLPITVTA